MPTEAHVWGLLPRPRDLGVQAPVRLARRAAAPPHVARRAAAARDSVGLVPVMHGVKPRHVLVHKCARALACRPHTPNAGARGQHPGVARREHRPVDSVPSIRSALSIPWPRWERGGPPAARTRKAETDSAGEARADAAAALQRNMTTSRWRAPHGSLRSLFAPCRGRRKRTDMLLRLQRRQQLSVAAFLAASVSTAAAGCAVHQECGSCLDATGDDNDSCFCAPHRSPRTHWL